MRTKFFFLIALFVRGFLSQELLTFLDDNDYSDKLHDGRLVSSTYDKKTEKQRYREKRDERQRDRETERQRDRETKRQRDRETETERQRDRETEKQRDSETERQRDRKTERLNKR